MLKHRIITALVLGPVLIFLVLWGNLIGFALLTAVIQLAASYEWLRIVKLKHLLAFVNALMITLLTNYLLYFSIVSMPSMTLVYVLVWALAVIWLFNNRWGYDNNQWQLLIKGICGLVAISLFNLTMHKLYLEPGGKWLVLALFVLIWVADVGAYVSGKTLGKHKLAVKISPGKTWEGVVGASVFVAIYSSSVASFLSLAWWHLLLIMVPVAWFSVIGDLAASLGKRQAQIKDSSNLLPGHGGFIDRFDSLIAAAPMFVILLFLIKG